MDLIFRNIPYFIGTRGLYLNKCTLDFDLTENIISAISFWVWLPHLQIHCWNNESMRVVGNTLGKYIDIAEPKSQYSYMRIYV